jgi:hypothetical protein
MATARFRRTAVLTATFALLALGGTAACGGSNSASNTPVDPNASEVNPPGDIPDDQVFVPYHSPDGTWSVKVPEGWARTEDGSSVTFTDKLNSVTVMQHPDQPAPTEASLKAAIDAAHGSDAGYSFESVDTVSRAGQEVPHVTYLLDSAPDSVTGKVVSDDVEEFAYYRNGTEVDLVLSGPHGADNVDPWQLVSDSFTWR